MAQQIKHTFCRICEPYCPVIAEFSDEGRVTKLSPDPGHPSGGIACHKGLSYLDVHNDPDRVNWPQKRLNPRSEPQGRFEELGWDIAMREIGASLKSILQAHGPNSVAVYTGNPWAMSASPLIMGAEFQDSINTQMRFGATTQDTANKFIGAAAIFGSSSSFMIPDLYNTEYLLCIGANPKVSRWTIFSVPNDNLEAVKQITKRGGKVRFVNPRKIESSTIETGPTLLIKPGTDVYFLAALLNEILVRGGFDEVLLEKHGKNVDDLKRFVQRYSARKVAAVTGIAATTIEEIAIEIITAKSAAVYMSTGVNQSRQGMLSYWLLEMINFATGNLGRKGGVHKPNGLTNYFPPNTGTLTVDTTLGTFRLPDPIGFSALPSVVLPDLIEKGDIRALIVLGGNPLLTMGGEQAMRKACEKLELIVSIDIYRNATGEISDYVLPATDWLERMDINIHGSGMQPIPYVQYTDAMEAPAAGRRNGWWILARLAQEIGVPSPLDKNPMSEDGVDLIDSMLAARNLSIEKMRELSGHTVAFPQERRDILFEWCLQHPDKKIDCYPASFVAAGLFERCDEIFAELEREPADILKLISLRVPYMQNSWLTNTEKFRRGKNAVNPLNINESDAVRYGLFDGDQVRVFNEYGSIETQILINNDLRVGVVAMSHGYGHSKTYGLEVACQNPGANCNALMPMGIGTYEPISYMSWISGVPVEIEKTSAAFESHES